MNINEYIKSINKQNQTIQNSISGIGSIQNVINSFKIPHQENNYLNVIGSFANLTKGISNINNYTPNISSINNLANLTKQFTYSTKNLTPLSNVSELLKGIGKVPNYNYALSGLTSSIALLSANNKILANSISNVASSQLIMSNSILEMTKHFNSSHLQKFNGLNIALQSVSNSFLKETFKNRNWENFSTVEKVNEVIASTAVEYVEKESLTIEDFNEFKSSVLIELNSLLAKTKTEKAKLFILNLIGVIGFIITLYTTFKPNNDISNADILSETKKEFEKLKIDLSKSIQYEFLKFNKIRISKTNVNLRFSTKKRSQIIGIVSKNQKVTVIEIRHKYLLISYIDKNTSEPKSGFVIKKYFKVK